MIGDARLVATLAAPYLPRRPTETVLYKLVRQNLESFLAYAREHYDGGLPRYVEQEFSAYLACGDFSRGFTRLSCEACGHDLLVAFSCGSRSICPSCTGRRMANVAAFLVDRVVPDVPVRQYVLTLPYELRKLVAFKADVLTAVARIFVESVFVSYRVRARRDGIEDAQCGSINFVQRFGSLNLHCHFHLVALDGVFARDAGRQVLFHPAGAPTAEDLGAIVAHAARRVITWLRRHGYLDEQPLEARSNEPAAQTALDACAAIAMGRGNVTTMPRDGTEDDDDGHRADEERPDTPALVVERDGFNLHAGVRIEAGDDLGRERLLRYAARPPLSLERLRRLPGDRVAYRLKYVARGRRGKYRVMTGVEFLARLAAITCPPRYPLTRFAGVLAPRSAWRREVVPKPRERPDACAASRAEKPAPAAQAPDKADKSKVSANGAPECDERAATTALLSSQGGDRAGSDGSARSTTPANDLAMSAAAPRAPQPGDVIQLAPNIISVKHWDRLLGGLLYAVEPRVDWATLLRRSLSVDVLECPKCHGRLRVVAVITEREPVQRILAHLGLPTESPPVARARDPTDDVGDDEAPAQLALGLP